LGIKRASQSGSVSQKSRWPEDHQFPQCCGENSGAISERSFSEKNCKEFEVIIYRALYYPKIQRIQIQAFSLGHGSFKMGYGKVENSSVS